MVSKVNLMSKYEMERRKKPSIDLEEIKEMVKEAIPNSECVDETPELLRYMITLFMKKIIRLTHKDPSTITKDDIKQVIENTPELNEFMPIYENMFNDVEF